jgi:putative spermidine/putrescine transport system permease protein
MIAGSAATSNPTRRALAGSISTYLYTRPRLVLTILLLPPALWLGVIYLGSLFSLLAQSFFSLDEFTGKVIYEPTIDSYSRLLRDANLAIIFRTATMAAIVTVISAIIAFPLAYYMARFASSRTKALLYIAVMLPLWSNYLVRVYAWRLILAKEGVIHWLFDALGLTWVLEGILALPIVEGSSLGNSYIGVTIVFVYIWLPYMILPIQAALERVPRSLIEAAGDLGARPRQTFRTVIVPLAIPGIVAGSIFTFSLTLGDYIIPQLFGKSFPFLGLSIIRSLGQNDLPMAAAMTVAPILIMAAYLTMARKLGAFDAL